MDTAYFFAAENDELVFRVISKLDEHARLGSTCDFGHIGYHFPTDCGAPGDRSARGCICGICIAVLRDSLGLLYTVESKNEGVE